VERNVVEPEEVYVKSIERTKLLKDMQVRRMNTSFLDD
jgi:hypothetical protein